MTLFMFGYLRNLEEQFVSQTSRHRMKFLFLFHFLILIYMVQCMRRFLDEIIRLVFMHLAFLHHLFMYVSWYDSVVGDFLYIFLIPSTTVIPVVNATVWSLCMF